MISKIYKTLLLSLLLTSTSLSQSNFIIEVNKIANNFYSPSVPNGLFTVTYTPGNQGVFLSVGAQNDAAGLFDIIVSNMYLPSNSETNSPSTFSTPFDFSLIAPPPYNPPASLILYIHILNGTGFYPFDPSTWADTKTVAVTVVNYNASGSIVPEEQSIEIKSVTRPGHTVGDSRSDYRHRKDAPNLDLDDSANGDTESFAGDLNACVPTATANSLKWMEATYTDFNLPQDMNLRKTMEKLSGLMKREKNEGTYTDKMIIGKLDFMEEYNLPVEVKFQAYYVNGNLSSTSGNSIARNFNPKPVKPPTWEFLKKMMKDGEDVEMNFTWKDPADNKWYAHSVNVTGINEFASGVKKIAFKHDRDQDASGGLIEEIHQISIDADGWMRFGTSNENFIRDVVVESPVVQEGRETAAWLNELFLNSGSNKISFTYSANQFIEVALKSTVSDLNNYTVTIYNGNSGEVYREYTLDQFTPGNTADGFKTYFKEFTSGELLQPPAGIAVSYTGTVIQNQFISYGGIFEAVGGDAHGLTSVNIGNLPNNFSAQLSGSSNRYSGFGWTYGEPSAGLINSDQSFTTSPLNKPEPVIPQDLQKNLSGQITFQWNKVDGATHYELQASTDPFFLSGILINETDLQDTTVEKEITLKGERIFWRVRAKNATQKGAYSLVRYFSTKLNTPADFRVQLTQDNKSKLDWTDNSENETGFVIERKDGSLNSSNQFVQIGSVNTNSYTDANVVMNNTYTYRIYAFNQYAESDYTQEKELNIATSVNDNTQLPVEFRLENNYPNPFNPTTTIRYHIPEISFVVLTVYDVLGNEIKKLVNSNHEPGVYSVDFQAKDYSNGVYFYKLQAGKFVSVKKMLLLK
ncbi:MAG TPA: T9SS type A sorting domain-containing protein [Melioribacteraceae bacterium]|nr:T9SS type A sorting domain-containing protein [Melioribacteraceae bacterium]